MFLIPKPALSSPSAIDAFIRAFVCFMLHADYSTISTSTYDKDQTYLLNPSGSHKVTYQPNSDWDCYVDVAQRSIDMSLILPHYRARYQPVDHRMNMFVGTEAGPVKIKVCRSFCRSRFYLEVQASMSDVEIFLPSDFRGRIQCAGKAKFSSGFVNRVMQNVDFTDDESSDVADEDCVVIVTNGGVMFRMWDVQTCAPENTQKETLKRIFGCSRKAPETTIDWDFLLED